MSPLHRAARGGDVEAVRAALDAGADVHAVGEYGFTALHAAAMGTNQAAEPDIMEVLRLLVAAGSPLEAFKPGDGRTALYLAAEFARSPAPVRLLADAGARVDVFDGHGNHVIINAMMPSVKALISELTGRPIPPPPPPQPKRVKMKAAEWRAARASMQPVFEAIRRARLIVLEDAGTTQSDGFQDCVETYHERGKPEIVGFCFYTRQDLNRAKRTSQLTLAFWGAPDGEPHQMERAGQVVVDAFREAGFVVDWNGSGAMRPTVFLAPNSED